MNNESKPAGYVPGAIDADGSEDPAPIAAIQSTGAALTEKSRLDAPGRSTKIDDDDQKIGMHQKRQADQAALPASPLTHQQSKK